MKLTSFLSVATLFLFTVLARAEFIPGQVFVAEFAREACHGPFDLYPGDRIWRINPETGEKFLFAALDEEACGSITDMIFTPDATRLRVAQYVKNRILEFDSDGNYTILYDVSDGIFAPTSANCMTFDAQGNFYVSVFHSILKFAANSQTREVYASNINDPFIGESGPIAFDSLGYLYYTNDGGGGQPARMLQFSAPNSRVVFQTSFMTTPNSLQGDSCGHLFVAYRQGPKYPGVEMISRFQNGDPATESVLIEGASSLGFSPRIALDPTQTILYVTTEKFDPMPGDYRVERFSIPTGIMESFVQMPSFPVGLTVVPVPNPSYGLTPCPPPIPTLSSWGAAILTLLLLILSKIAFGNYVRSKKT